MIEARRGEASLEPMAWPNVVAPAGLGVGGEVVAGMLRPYDETRG
jgi:hypothetical protein